MVTKALWKHTDSGMGMSIHCLGHTHRQSLLLLVKDRCDGYNAQGRAKRRAESMLCYDDASLLFSHFISERARRYVVMASGF